MPQYLQNPKNKFIQNLGGAPLPKPQMVSAITQNKPRLPSLGGGPIATASPSATAPIKTSPAKEQYVNNLAQSSAPMNTPDLSSLKTGLEGLSSSLAAFQQNQAAAPKADPNAGYRTAFEEYIKSLSPTSEETAAQDRLNQITTQNRLAYEKALQSGETLGYATGLAGEQARTAGIQEAGAAASLDALTGRRKALTEAQKARLEFEKSMIPDPEEAFTLGEGQVRYGPNGEVIASGLPKSPSLPASAQEYQYAVSQGYKGTYQDYQNEDANRKRSITNINGGGETPTNQQLKVFINKQIATPEFQALSPEEKALYIQSQGGTPYDFGY